MHGPCRMLALTHSPTMRPNTVVGRTPSFCCLVDLGRLDISGKEALTLWLSPSFQVDSEKEVESSSGLFPRLDRWLAGELIKSMKSIPEFSFRAQGHVEGCTRQVKCPEVVLSCT